MYIPQFYMTINVVYNIKLSTESDLKNKTVYLKR